MTGRLIAGVVAKRSGAVKPAERESSSNQVCTGQLQACDALLTERVAGMLCWDDFGSLLEISPSCHMLDPGGRAWNCSESGLFSFFQLACSPARYRTSRLAIGPRKSFGNCEYRDAGPLNGPPMSRRT